MPVDDPAANPAHQELQHRLHGGAEQGGEFFGQNSRDENDKTQDFEESAQGRRLEKCLVF